MICTVFTSFGNLTVWNAYIAIGGGFFVFQNFYLAQVQGFSQN